MCNNSLFEDSGAKNLSGLSNVPKTRISLPSGEGVVGEHFQGDEARPVRASGALGRENVGMSNRKARENRAPRKSKVSSATKIGGGLGDPKAMAKAAAKGTLVNIPALPFISMG